MYASRKLSKIKNAVILFAKKRTVATKKTINLFLELIRFGIIYILISFDGEYCEYHVGVKEEQGLSIVEHESAFLANLLLSYLFEKSKTLLIPTTYHSIY